MCVLQFMRLVSCLILTALSVCVFSAPISMPWMNTHLSPDERAHLLLQAMTQDEKLLLVFGHFGYSHAKHGVTDKGFQGLLDLMQHQRAWVKMTGPYRICDGNLPYLDMRPFSDAVIKANPSRLIWGSDWPHVMVKKQMPHDADLCDLLGDWVQDENLRNSILVDNPCILYDFPADN